jgi:WD40 repeat protein
MLVGAKVLVKRSLGSYQLMDVGDGAADAAFGALHAANAVGCHAATIVAATEQGDEILKRSGGVVARRTQPSPVRGLAYAASGSAIAARLQDGTMAIYDSELSGEIARFAEPFGLGIQLDAEGRLLARWEADDTRSRVRVFEIASGRMTVEWSVPSRINDLRFDPRGARVVLALQDKSVQVWDTQQGVALAAFRHEAASTCACFTADADIIASGGWDDTVRIWPWKSEALVRAACGRLERNLTEAEWTQYIPGEAYRKTCEKG